MPPQPPTAPQASEVVAHAALLSCGEFATHSELREHKFNDPLSPDTYWSQHFF